MRFGFAPVLFEMAIEGDRNQANSRAWNGNCSQVTWTLGAIPSLGWSLCSLCLFLISLIRCQHLGDWTVGRAPLRGRFPFRLSHSLCPPYERTVECVVFAPRVPACKDVCRGAHTGSKNVFIRLLMCAVVWSTDLSSQIGWRGLIVYILGKPQSNDSGGVDIFLLLL